jgi:hypothetical protein
LAELRELNADLTWTDVSEVAELDALKPALVIGYSREQMEDALRHFIGPFRSIDIEYYMNSLTPAAAEVLIPTAVLLLLNQIENLTLDDDYSTAMNLIYDHAKEAMALLTKGRGEAGGAG